jgi:hypothetical protein
MSLVTLVEVKEEIGLPLQTFEHDKFLNRKIASMSDLVEKYCNRTFALTGEKERIDFPLGVVILKKLPVTVVTAFNIDGTVSTEYYIDKEDGLLSYQKAPDQPRKWSNDHYKEYIEIEYSAGFAAIPDAIKDVVLSLVRGEFFNREGDPTKDMKFESSPGSVSTSFFDAARLHPMLGRYVGILDEYKMESGMIV